MQEKSSNKLLMVLGPTEIEDDVLSLGSLPQQYHRTPDFTAFLSGIFANLQYLFQTQNPVFILSSSGTGAMEFSVTNLLSNGERALYINGGTFGERWGDICRKHGVVTSEIKLSLGKSVECSQIEKALDADKTIKVLFATQNETATGALTDIESVGKVAKKHGVLFVVDAVSSLGVQKMPQDEWGVDVLLTSSQKALALPPGLGFVSFSERAIEKARVAKPKTLYFDVFEYLKDWERNQTPFTPPISLIYQLELRLRKIKETGLENFQNEYLEKTNYLRQGIKSLGLEFAADVFSNCVTGVKAPEGIDALEIVRIMDEHQIAIAPSPGNLKTKLFRVGNFGNINQPDIERFLISLKLTLHELGYKNG